VHELREASSTSPFPNKLTWHGREVERVITQTDLATRVSFAQLVPKKQAPSNASAFVILARGPVTVDDMAKRLVGTAAKIDVGTPRRRATRSARAATRPSRAPTRWCT
jgi:hypothetical protein